MAHRLAHARALAGNAWVEPTIARRESPLLIDAEIAMNALARLDEMVSELTTIRRVIVDGIARYERTR